jgi:hypothetical protein
MKKQSILKFVARAFVMLLFAAFAFSVVSMISPDTADSLVALLGLTGGGTGFTMANTTIIATNTRETTSNARPRSVTDPGHLADDVSKFVTMIKPDDFSLDTLLREMNSSEKATDLIVNYEEVDFRGHADQVTTALDAPVGTGSDMQFRSIVVGNPNLWVIGESIYVKSVLGLGGRPLQLRVDNINANNTLTVTGINTTGGIVPALPINTPIRRSATAYGEDRARAENKTLIPGNRFNNCQRHLAQIDEGYIRAMIDTKSGFSDKDQNFIRMYDFRTEIEKTSIFGNRSTVFSQRENANVLYANGIYHQLEKVLPYTTAGGITTNTWIDWTRLIFADNSGAEDRMLFAGSQLMANILKIPAIEKQLQADRVEVVPGIKVMKVETSFGILYLKFHKLFDIMDHAHDGMVVDLTNIKKRPFLALNSRELDLRSSGQSNTNATLIEEIGCVETRYLATHARIVNTAP